MIKLENGGIAELARKLKTHEYTPNEWKRLYRQRNSATFSGKDKLSEPAGDLDGLQRGSEQMRRALADSGMECELV